ncbi:alpha-pore-forming tripartite toxin MakABE regulator [Hymenobacter chitinivorans]|uniref:Inclusion body protein n=1 Tax=Hymenobacter chitinivorans DSM 11115 TaxID=1121954 RepID=A0A2M9AQD7_9BACT|nr:hypothetical protein [Hymenobacter chitinivorans]PJJ47914.1 hypothetical protein CLV45_4604 [Hymenobacter chitinivorans DSM 11115]
MSQINVLIAVDALGAVVSGNLQGNVYLIDTNKFMGSNAEGNSELVTSCHDEDTIVWTVAPIDPGINVVISSFTGDIVTQNICIPKKQDGEGLTWKGTVVAPSPLPTSNTQYSVVLSIDGTQMAFDPFLSIVPTSQSLAAK